MRVLKALLIKEFKQIFRNKGILPLIFGIPLIQLLILPLAADYEIKNLNIAVVDHDRSSLSKELVSKVLGSGYFVLSGYADSYQEAMPWIEQDEADLVLEIPHNFERELRREQVQEVFIAANAINGVKANLGTSYLVQIVMEYSEQLNPLVKDGQGAGLSIQSSNWFNPMLNYNFFMVPGILVFLVTLVGAFLSSLNIVKEKEVGTIEQINVTPIKKHQFIAGKLIPFWVIGMFVFTLGLFVIAWQVYGIVPVGNLGLLYGYLALYLVAVLGMGLLISTYSATQQQAMSIAFFFLMIFLLMGGLFTSIDSMPEWSQWIARSNPVTYFIEVIRMIILKGSGAQDIMKHFLITLGFALVLNVWAVLNYRKTT
jgi:ABC-2 type transport system permease protein